MTDKFVLMAKWHGHQYSPFEAHLDNLAGKEESFAEMINYRFWEFDTEQERAMAMERLQNMGIENFEVTDVCLDCVDHDVEIEEEDESGTLN